MRMQGFESILQSIFHNTVAMLCVKILMPVSYFLITVTLARVLGVKDFGVLAVIWGYHGIFCLIATFGLDSYLLREMGKDHEKAPRLLNQAYLLGTIVSWGCIVGMNALLFVMGYSHELRLAGFILSLALWPIALTRCLDATFVSFHKGWAVVMTSFLREGFKIVAVLFVLFRYRQLLPVAMMLMVSAFVGLGLNFGMAHRILPFITQSTKNLVWKVGAWDRMLHTSAVLTLISAVNSVFLAVDVLVLSKLQGPVSVGHYSAAYKFITAFFLVLDSVGIALLPVMSEWFCHSQERFEQLVQTFFRYFFGFVFVGVCSVFLLSDVLILGIFGNAFQASIPILKILVWAPLFLGSSYFMGKMLLAGDLQRYDVRVLGVACALNIILSIGMTLKWGAVGTASATVISMAALCGMHHWYVAKYVCAIFWGPYVLRSLLGGGIFVGVFVLLRPVQPFLAFVSALCVGVGSLFMMRLFKWDDVIVLKSTVMEKV